MLVTIMSDASFCHDTKAAGYGFWIVCARGRFSGGGEFRVPVANSNLAEAMGAVNALHIARQRGLVEFGDSVLFQLDSMVAINALQSVRAAAGYEKIHTTMWKMRYDLASVVFKHVKAHSGVGDKRSYVNEFCDRLAKSSMRAARNRLVKLQKAHSSTEF